MQDGIVKLGTWGGEGGGPWSTELGSRLARIRINHCIVIDALQFQFERNGELHWTKRCGGDGGSNSEIVLQDGEYLTCILGHYGNFQGHVLVRSLTFISNIRKYGPYGDESGTFFCLPQVQGNVIEGFHGRCCMYMDSIGVYWRPIHPKISGTNKISGTDNEEGVVKLGPWGGEGGRPWSTELGSRLARIRINHGIFIDALQFQFERNRELHWTKRCGGDGGSHSEIVLEDGEYLTCILGHYGNIQGYVLVRSLTFISNIREYGPYGDESGTFFCLPQVQGNMIEGFHGRCGLYMDSIGVYWRPIHPKISGTNNERPDTENQSCMGSIFSCLGTWLGILKNGTWTISLGPVGLEWKPGSSLLR